MTRRNLIFSALLIALVFGLVSCTKSGGSDGKGKGGKSGSGKVRFFLAVPELATADLYLGTDDQPITLEYGVATDYMDVDTDAEDRRVEVFVSGSLLPLVDEIISVGNDEDRTFFIFGDPKPDKDGSYKVRTKSLVDQQESDINDRISVRIVHGAPSEKSIDVFVDTVGDDGEEVIPFEEGTSFAGASRYLDGLPGTGTVRVQKHGNDPELLYQGGSVEFEKDQAYTFVFLDGPGGSGAAEGVILVDGD